MVAHRILDAIRDRPLNNRPHSLLSDAAVTAKNFRRSRQSPRSPVAHVFNPARAFLLVGKGQPIQAFADRLYSGKTQHATLKTAQSTSAEIWKIVDVR